MQKWLPKMGTFTPGSLEGFTQQKSAQFMSLYMNDKTTTFLLKTKDLLGETIRLFGKGAWGWGKREIIYQSLHCHHQNDPCMGNDESHSSCFQRNRKFCGIKYELLLLKFNNLHITGAKHFSHCMLFCFVILYCFYTIHYCYSLSFWLSLSLPFSLCLNLFLSLTLSHTQQHIDIAQKLLKWKKCQPFLIFAVNVILLVHSFWEQPIYKYHVQLSKLKKVQWLHDLSPSCWGQNMLQYVWSPPQVLSGSWDTTGVFFCLFSISSVFFHILLFTSCHPATGLFSWIFFAKRLPVMVSARKCQCDWIMSVITISDFCIHVDYIMNTPWHSYIYICMCVCVCVCVFKEITDTFPDLGQRKFSFF